MSSGSGLARQWIVNSSVGAGANSVITLNGAGRDRYGAQDAFYFASQPLSGNGQIVARLDSLQLYWDNRAGVMIRESLAPDARYVSLAILKWIDRHPDRQLVVLSGRNDEGRTAVSGNLAVARRRMERLADELISA